MTVAKSRTVWVCGFCTVKNHDRCARGWRNTKGVLICGCEDCEGKTAICLRCGNREETEVNQDDWLCNDNDACRDTLSARAEANPVRHQLRLVYSEKLSRRQQDTADRIRREVAANPDDPNAGKCQCGCGGTTKGGKFQPGHDSKLMSRLRKEARSGKKAVRDKALAEITRRGWDNKL